MIRLDFAHRTLYGRLPSLVQGSTDPEILRGGEAERRRFDPKSAAPFVNKSISEATRRAYSRAVREFFHFASMKHPSEVVPNDILLWRDRLRSQKKSAATVAFKLSVVRSFSSDMMRGKVMPWEEGSSGLVPAQPKHRVRHCGYALR